MRELARRLFRPVPLIAVAASVLTFWVTGVWWLLPLGLLAAGAVAALSGSPEPDISAELEADALAGCGPDVRAKLQNVAEEKARVLTELRHKRNDGVLDGEDVAARVEEVVRTYRDLLARLQEIKPLLDDRGLAALKRSIDDLERQVTTSQDEIARENLSLALKNRVDERNRILELGRYRERVEAQLLGLASALTNLRVRLVQSRVSRDETLDPVTGIRESLDGLFREVEVAERTSRELNEMVRGARSGGSAARRQRAAVADAN